MEKSHKSLGYDYKISQNRSKARNKIWKEQAITLFPDIAQSWSTPKRPAWQLPKLYTPAALSPSPGQPQSLKQAQHRAVPIFRKIKIKNKRPKPQKRNCAGLKANRPRPTNSSIPRLKLNEDPRRLLLPRSLPSQRNSVWEEPPFPSPEQLRPAYPHCAPGHPALAIVSAQNRYRPHKDRDEEKEAWILGCAAFKRLPHPVHPSLTTKWHLPRPSRNFSGN